MPTRTTQTSTRTTQTRTQTRTTPAEGAAAALERCLEPVEAERFLSEFWERKPLAVRRDGGARFDDLLSIDDVERLVCSSGIRYPGLRLVKEGAQLGPSDYTVDLPWRPVPFTGFAEPDRVLAEYERGATIVLQALHYHWAPLAEFSRALELRLGEPVQANAYLTPPRSQGFAVHHDTHDVFVLQLAGSKRWLVYEPALELPLRSQRYSRRLGRPEAPVEDLELRAGDTLYLPRGWLHEALTSEAESLHLTIGVNVHTRLDALKAALEECGADVEFRRSVPVDGELDAELLARLAARLAPEDVVRRKRKRLAEARRPLQRDGFGRLRALASLTVETPVERRRSVIADLSRDGSTVTLTFAGKRLTFPSQAQAALEHAFAATAPFRASALPGTLNDEGRLVLVRRLVREGFLQLVTAGDGSDAPWPRSDGGA